MYYILFYKTVDNYVERRKPYREEHLEYAKAAHDKGVLLMAGALSEPADGAVALFKGDNPGSRKNLRKMILMSKMASSPTGMSAPGQLSSAGKYDFGTATFS